MIYQYVKRYLKNNFEKPSQDIIWSPLENVKFFNYIDDRYTTQEILKNISEVKEAFKDFFEPIGTIIFRYKEDIGINFKIFPYRVQPKDSKYLKEIINIIHKNKKSIKYPYKDQTDQIAITGKIRRQINLEINDSDESVNKKELIKFAIRKALALGKRDIVVQLKRIYLVKIFESNSITKNISQKPIQREGIENRYNGYTQEDFKDNYNRIFKDIELNIFLEPIMKDLFTNKLNFSEISNKYYEDNALKVIHSQIAKELVNYVSLEDDFIMGLAGYIFRQHFYKIHELIAIELLEEVYNKISNAEKFLMYYNGKIIFEKGVKYKIPALETKDGKRLNSSSILGLSALWINTTKKKESRTLKLEEANKKISETEDGSVSVQLKIKELFNKIGLSQKEIEATKDSLKNQLKEFETFEYNGLTYSAEEIKLKNDIENNENKLEELKDLIHEYQKEIDELEKSNQSLNEYKDYKKRLQNDIKEFDKNIRSNLERVNIILEALVNALISRKKIVKE